MGGSSPRRCRIQPRALVGAALAAWVIAAPAGPASARTPAIPIAQNPAAALTLPAFTGAPAVARPQYEPSPPRHPFMAANGRSELHDDAYQSDTYPFSGPLGRGITTASTSVGGDCASLTFDRLGRLVSVCVGLAGPTLYMFDPVDLSVLASLGLPPKQPGAPSANPFQDFTGGGYFYLDNADRVIVPTTTRHVEVIAETGGATTPGFAVQRDYDLTPSVPAGDRLTSALPSWDGHIVFESFNGIVGTIAPATGAVHALALGEETENSFAVDETGGVFVVSTRALYRLDLAADGRPQVSWRAAYPNSQIHKPGQVDAGSGTTPTIQGPYVSITDNADPLDVVVYRRARVIDRPRLVCTVPVFAPGAGADENSVIGAGNLMVVENNYGYTGPAAVSGGATTAPGVARVDIAPDGQGCRKVWENDAVSIPTVVAKASLGAGLIYGYTKDSDPLDPWWFTALDLGTGRETYRALAGTGTGFNNNYAPITLGPDGTAYVGVLAGLVALRDAVPPPPSIPLRPGSRVAPPRLRLVARALRRGRIRVGLAGPLAGVRRVRFVVPARGRTVRHRPFTVTLGPLPVRAGRRVLVRAVVVLRHGPPRRLVVAVRTRR